jgi:hypothetical protein
LDGSPETTLIITEKEINTNPTLFGIGQVAVTVRDIDRTITFNRAILGMRFLSKAAPGLGFF